MDFYYYYLILVLPAVLVLVWAQYKVKSTFRKYSGVAAPDGMTGAAASELIQRANGLSVPVSETAGELTDYYNPKTDSIHLSNPVYGAATIAAVGVAAHETGHALQYAERYAPVRFRTALVPVTNIATSVSPLMLILGLVSGYGILAYIGIALFGTSVLFQLATLPVEFNASRRAVRALEASGRFTEDEMKGVKKVLFAAAMTYVAALLVSLMQLLRLLLIYGGRRRRR